MDFILIFEFDGFKFFVVFQFIKHENHTYIYHVHEYNWMCCCVLSYFNRSLLISTAALYLGQISVEYINTKNINAYIRRVTVKKGVLITLDTLSNRFIALIIFGIGMKVIELYVTPCVNRYPSKIEINPDKRFKFKLHLLKLPMKCSRRFFDSLHSTFFLFQFSLRYAMNLRISCK